jgi:hypothetical protein
LPHPETPFPTFDLTLESDSFIMINITIPENQVDNHHRFNVTGDLMIMEDGKLFRKTPFKMQRTSKL